MVARFWPTQGELNVTVVDVVYGEPVWSIRLTCKDVLPPADSAAVEMAMTPGAKAAPVPLPIETVVDPLLVPTTATETCCGVTAPAVAVTVMVDPTAAPTEVRVAMAEPVASVV